MSSNILADLEGPRLRPREAPPDGRFVRELPGRLAAFTCYFNPCDYVSLKRNYRRFARGMAEQGVPLYTAELAFEGQPFALEGDERTRRFRARDVMWHKERLLNLLLPAVPRAYDKIAWIDAGLLFADPRWPREAARRLEEFPVVQLFDEAVYLDRDGQASETRTGVARAIADGLDAQNFGRFHPGFAWAARRELLERRGLMDTNIAGGGDSMMVCAMFGWWNHPMQLRYDAEMRQSLAAWGRPLFDEVRGRVGYVPGRALHLWHGARADRRYVERIDWLNHARFDPRSDLRPGDDGLWEWSGEKAWLREKMRAYFFDRREDG
jgi:hypothetical protein